MALTLSEQSLSERVSACKKNPLAEIDLRSQEILYTSSDGLIYLIGIIPIGVCQSYKKALITLTGRAPQATIPVDVSVFPNNQYFLSPGMTTAKITFPSYVNLTNLAPYTTNPAGSPLTIIITDSQLLLY